MNYRNSKRKSKRNSKRKSKRNSKRKSKRKSPVQFKRNMDYLYHVNNRVTKKTSCDVLCDLKKNTKYSWNDNYDDNKNDPNLTEFNSDKISGVKKGKKCRCRINRHNSKVINSDESKVLDPRYFIGKNSENYWTGFDDEFWSKNKGFGKYPYWWRKDKVDLSGKNNDYKTKYRCIKDKDGNYKNITSNNLSICYSFLYLSLYIIYRILSLLKCDKVFIKNIKKSIKLLDKLYDYDNSLLTGVGSNIHVKTLFLHYILLKKGLLIGDYNIYNRMCHLHCGKCAKCSTEKDIDVIFKTKEYITQKMTECSVKYARPGGHKGKYKLEDCLRNEHIDFTPMCRDVWYDDIDCASSFCKMPCRYKFLTFRKTQDPSCIECDEKVCGPGFIHAGANRRSTGIISDIKRSPNSTCKEGVYSKYFDNKNSMQKLDDKLKQFLDEEQGDYRYIRQINTIIYKYIDIIEEQIYKHNIKRPVKIIDIAKLYDEYFTQEIFTKLREEIKRKYTPKASKNLKSL